MNIQFYTFSPNSTNNKALPQTKSKTGQPNFCAMKKSNFEGFDLVCVNRFKAPIEKFNSSEDLHKWAKDRLRKILQPNQYRTNDHIITAERTDILENWDSFFTRDKNYKNNPALSLIIADGITRNLSTTNKDIPPILYPKALSETLEQIKQNLSEIKGYSFNFEKIYSGKLRNIVMKDVETIKNTNETKWIKIPSADNDDENFDLNVEKLKILSHRTWCTKFTHARPYLAAGDMYIYLEKGHPKLCIRMINDSIDEIQGKKNNGHIPVDEINNIIDFINQEHLDPRLITKNIQETKEARKTFYELKTKIAPLIKENDRKKLFALFNIRANFDNDGMLILSHFNQPSKYYSYSDLGINEKKLLAGLKKIERDGDFAYSSLEVLNDLEEIGQNAYFNNSQIRLLPKLKTIGSLAKFSDSLREAPMLESIGFNAWMSNCEDIKFNSLKRIDGDLFITDSKIKILPELETVTGEIHNSNSETKFPKLIK